MRLIIYDNMHGYAVVIGLQKFLYYTLKFFDKKVVFDPFKRFEEQPLIRIVNTT